uniref:Uncharacterized protein n=1 Tax=Rhizophora mucronata TaxID=61149 RepID=A0A2P2Q8V3_RHIMU
MLACEAICDFLCAQPFIKLSQWCLNVISFGFVSMFFYRKVLAAVSFTGFNDTESCY